MGSTYTDNGGIEKIGLGEQAGAWGTTTNNNFDIVDRLINGVGSISLSGTTHTLTTSDGSLSDGMFKVLVLGGSPSGTNTITIEPNNADKLYFVKNASGQSVTFTQGSGANVTILNGFGAIIFADGAGSGAAVTDLTALFTTSQAIDNVVIGGTTPAAGSFTTVTANGGVTVDNINIDGTEIDLSSGDLTIDVAGDINLDADGGDVILKDDGVEFARLVNSSDRNLVVQNTNSDKDISFLGNDNGSSFTALTLDMSEGGNATFNGTVTTTGLTLGSTAVTATGAELNIMDGVTATKDELNIMDGVTATTAELNHTDGVTSNIQTQLNTKHDAVGSGLQEDDATTVSLKNSFISNTSSAISTGTATSFTASTYPTFISGATTSSGGGSFTVTIGGSSATLNMRDGDSGTFDTFATLLPAGATISGNQFQYLAVQLRPG